MARTIEDFQKDLQKLLNSKKLNTGWVHVDFMDNIFVPNQSIDPDDLIDIDFKQLKKEAHLMVNEPGQWISKPLNLGFKRIIIHAEIPGDIARYLRKIKQGGSQAGLAINPATSIEKLTSFVSLVDIILVMGVVPGFQGQSFIPEILDKIREIKKQGWDVNIEVDGAVKDTNARQIIESGADILISGSYLINGDPDQNLARLLDSLSSAKM